MSPSVHLRRFSSFLNTYNTTVKAGYPPKSLPLTYEAILTELGLKAGEQIIVTQRPGGTPIAPSAQPSAPAKVKALPAPVAEPPSTRYSRPQSDYSDGGPDYVSLDAGVLVHRIIPDDNSCLFSSIALVFEQSISKAPMIRQIVAEAIQNDPDSWSEVILGHPRQDYISTILRPSSWGGAIELAILSAHYNTEIASIDVETSRIDQFSPDSSSGTGNRCILIYSGIHYDAASLAPSRDAPSDFHQTVFPIIGSSADDDPVLRAATDLAAKLRAKHQFTNTSTFDLKCEICKIGLKGEKEARAHAKETGHTDFGEY